MKLKTQALICFLGLAFILSCAKPETEPAPKNTLFKSTVLRLWKRKALQVIPVQKPSTANRLVPLQDQWSHKEGPFSIVVYQKASMVNAPIDHPVLLYDLSVSERVTALDIAPIRTTADREEGPWVYVTHSDFPEGGWIRRRALGFVSDFRPLSWSYDQYDYLKGDLATSYFIKPNGRYVASWTAQGSGLKMKGQYYGQMMQYEDVIWAQKDEQDDFYDFFWIDLNDTLHLEWRYKDQHLKNTSVKNTTHNEGE